MSPSSSDCRYRKKKKNLSSEETLILQLSYFSFQDILQNPYRNRRTIRVISLIQTQIYKGTKMSNFNRYGVNNSNILSYIINHSFRLPSCDPNNNWFSLPNSHKKKINILPSSPIFMKPNSKKRFQNPYLGHYAQWAKWFQFRPQQGTQRSESGGGAGTPIDPSATRYWR